MKTSLNISDTASLSSFDSQKYRKDFPLLEQKQNLKPLIYLDNAATTQKPQSVIDSLIQYYTHENANIHRGIYTLSEKATVLFEETREAVQKFINAGSKEEIVFVRGTTEAINLVASSYGQHFIQAGDEIVISYLEHHSNIVPWQIIAQKTGAQLKVIPINIHGELDMNVYSSFLTPKTKLVAITHISNALGTINPIETMIQKAHILKIPVFIDGAQAIAHTLVDVQKLDCDFYAFSGHKMYGPTGIGVLYGKKKWLEIMPPYQSGGDMISAVSFENTTYNHLPYKWEAGTPHIAGVIGLKPAIEYLQSIGLKPIADYENSLLEYATQKLSQIQGLKIIGQARNKSAIISFILKDIHPHDIGTFLNEDNIAVRAGHHCAMPIMEWFKIDATVRASFAFYNTYDEIDHLANSIATIIRFFH